MTDRILTSHAGSLPRPTGLLELYRGDPTADEIQGALSSAVADVVRRQQDLGLDIVNDGEFGKPMSEEQDYSAWGSYAFGRLGGYTMRKLEGESWAGSKDAMDFPEFYASGGAEATDEDLEIGVCTGPITYEGQDQVQGDIAHLKAALDGSATAGAFISSLSAGGSILWPGDYYATEEEEAIAMAEALREEYKAITDAGFIVQLDNPHLVDKFTFDYSLTWDIKSFRKWAEHHVELVNHSLEGIPEELVRYHVCWGSWKGPHMSDLPLKEVVDLVLKVKAKSYSVEAANPRHEHEWQVWREVKLPEGRTVMPGVVTHKTNVVEHPEVVAERLIKYAEAVGRENVIAGTDCGMGGRIHPELAWAKLAALTEGAELASKKLWGR